MSGDQRARVEKWASEQSPPQPTLSDAIRRLIDLGLAAEYEHTPLSVSITRWAKRNHPELASASTPPAATEKALKKQAAEKAGERAALASARAKELAIGAVKQKLAKVDAPIEEKIERARRLIAPSKAKKPAGPR